MTLPPIYISLALVSIVFGDGNRSSNMSGLEKFMAFACSAFQRRIHLTMRTSNDFTEDGVRSSTKSNHLSAGRRKHDALQLAIVAHPQPARLS